MLPKLCLGTHKLQQLLLLSVVLYGLRQEHMR